MLALVAAAALAGWFWPYADDIPPPVVPTATPATTTGSEHQSAATPEAISRLAVSSPGDASADDATPDPAGSLTGLVLDLANRALPGALVVVRPSSGSGAAGAAADATTDATGRWFVADLAPGNYRVRATASGFVAAVASAKASEAIETQVETLRLAPGTTLRGIVVDSGGSCLAGATVHASGERSETGSDGRFEVPHVPVTPIAVEVSCPGWLSWQRTGVDPAQELRVVLPAGLVLSGAVRDATTGAPVELFALRAVRLQPLRSVQQGTPEWQLQHRIQKLQQGLATATDPQARAADERAIAEYSARLAGLQGAAPPAHGVPDAMPAPAAHEAGQFVVDRLDEGLYVVEVLSPDHVFARTPPFALRRDVVVPPLRIDLQRGQRVHGLVLTADERPIPGATVELLRVRAAAPDASASVWLQWLVGERPPEGDFVARSVTGADGMFTLPCQPPGTLQVLARHGDHATAASAPFATGSPEPVRITMLPRACLAGVVRGAPAGSAGEVFVLLLGGASNLRCCAADGDGGYRFERLEPGEYLVRAGLGDRDKFAADLLRSLATAAEAPRRDAVLRAGERRTLDLALVPPPAGRVRGLVQRNGLPEPACRVLVDVPGAARPLTAVADAQGQFAFPTGPAGECTLRVLVRGSRSQELHRETITVVVATETFVQPTLQVGELAGRIVAGDGTAAADLNGEIWLLPGVDTLPASLADYRRAHTVQQASVRSGVFRCDLATAGRSLAVVRLRNRDVAVARVEVPPGATAQVELPAGARR